MDSNLTELVTITKALEISMKNDFLHGSSLEIESDYRRCYKLAL